MPKGTSSPQASALTIADSLNRSLPSILNTVNAGMVPSAQAQLAADMAVSPAYNELLTNLYRQYAPQLASIGAGVDTTARLGQAAGSQAILDRYGVPMAQAERASDIALNPEAAAAKDAASKSVLDLLGSINLNNPNPEAERLVSQENARSGNLSTPDSSTKTVANALSFGNQLQKRRDALGAAIGQATGFITGATNNFNPVNQAVSAPAPTAGTSQFAGVTSNAGANSQNTANNMLSGITQLRQQQTQLADQNTPSSIFAKVTGSLP